MPKPAYSKEEIIQMLREMAQLLELKDENIFKIRAFENAARVLEGAPADLKTLLETDELEKLKGIGKGHISKMIREIFKTGRCRYYEDLKKGFPAGLFELFKIPGLGAKRIKVLYDQLAVKSVGELEYACHENRLLDLPGFGAKSQENILRNIERLKKSAGRFLFHEAKQKADQLLAYLKKKRGILKIEIAGSLRRRKEVIGDIDILVSAKDPAAIHNAFSRYPEVEAVTAQGETKTSVVLKNGMSADLRTVAEKEFPFALYYFTGSKEHNVAVRTIAKRKNIKINEYGLFKGKRFLACKDEAEIFERVGLHDIPPEARENTGEIEWAAKREFPRLVEKSDLRGVFHVHSNYSDGVAPLEDMIAKAQDMGLDYVGISDHSQSAKYAKGLEPARLRIQWKEIDALQKNFKIRIFKGIESDILPDGRLDYPDSVLAQFDFVIGSVHSKFTMGEKEMTGRIRRAMENKYLTFWGHPTGRLLLAREGYPLDMDRLMEAARKQGVVIELNAHPSRLDLDWHFCQEAKRRGILLSINPDAHSVAGLEDIEYGVGIARKGWLEKKDVVNTLPLSEIEKFLKRRR